MEAQTCHDLSEHPESCQVKSFCRDRILLLQTTGEPTNTRTRDDGLSFWLEKWEQQKIGFHESEINAYLKEYIDEFIVGRSHIRIFFPLCGKAVEMKWLADQGHVIVGVDGSQLAVEAFFSESSLEFTTQPVDKVKGVLYKCTTLPISIYCCDFMLFTSDLEEPFDAIWDRGGLGAIRFSNLSQYSKLMISLMGPECRFMIETFKYDDSACENAGPPSSIDEDIIEKNFGEVCNWKLLASRLHVSKRMDHLNFPESFKMEICLWLITPK